SLEGLLLDGFPDFHVGRPISSRPVHRGCEPGPGISASLTERISGTDRSQVPEEVIVRPAFLSMLFIDATAPATATAAAHLGELRRAGHEVTCHLIDGGGKVGWARELGALGIRCTGFDPADAPADPGAAAAWRRDEGGSLAA